MTKFIILTTLLTLIPVIIILNAIRELSKRRKSLNISKNNYSVVKEYNELNKQIEVNISLLFIVFFLWCSVTVFIYLFS